MFLIEKEKHKKGDDDDDDDDDDSNNEIENDKPTNHNIIAILSLLYESGE